jgi:formylglycine-generating enzyme required for sulfatase activity
MTVAAVAGSGIDTFTVSGDVTNDGGTPVMRRGVVHGLTAAPTLGAAMDAPAAGTGTGAFSSALTGLSPETTYYARAYATSTVGIGYGADITFKTAPATPAGFSFIPAGSFQMGDALDGIGDAPVRQVTVSAFYMAQRETTKALWDEVRDWGVSRGYTDLPIGGDNSSNHPAAHSMSWYDLIKWCNAFSEKDGLAPVYTVNGATMRTGQSEPEVDWTAKGYRLPTEAEWEKAARGGFYDISGNIMEWCWDWYGAYAAGAQTDPKGSITGTARVVRGGSWGSRSGLLPYLPINPTLGNYNNIGFRLARGL